MSVSCKGCGRSFSFMGYNAHHSHQDAKPECQGRENAQVSSVAVNTRNYRVSVQDTSSRYPGRDARAGGSRDPDLDSDGDSEPGPWQAVSHAGGADSDAAGSGPGESCILHCLHRFTCILCCRYYTINYIYFTC
jgi:hypothetical protein